MFQLKIRVACRGIGQNSLPVVILAKSTGLNLNWNKALVERAKIEEIPLRVALILHCVRRAVGNCRADRVDTETMKAAIKIANWHMAEAERIYDIMATEALSRPHRELADWIWAKGGTIATRDLVSGKRQIQNSEQANEQLNASNGKTRWRLQFRIDGSQSQIRLGAIRKSAAIKIQRMVDDLIIARRLNIKPGIQTLRRAGASLSGRFHQIAEKAGLAKIQNPFRNLRLSATNDVCRIPGITPATIVDWFGHDLKTAMKHYHRTTDRDFDAALTADPSIDQVISAKPVQKLATSCPRSGETGEAGMQKLRETEASRSLQTQNMTPTGLRQPTQTLGNANKSDLAGPLAGPLPSKADALTVSERRLLGVQEH